MSPRPKIAKAGAARAANKDTTSVTLRFTFSSLRVSCELSDLPANAGRRGRRALRRAAHLGHHGQKKERDHANDHERPDSFEHVTIKPLDHEILLQIAGHLMLIVSRKKQIVR